MEFSDDRVGGRSAPAGRPVGASGIGPRYAVALAAFGAALLFRYLFRDSLGLKVPYL